MHDAAHHFEAVRLDRVLQLRWHGGVHEGKLVLADRLGVAHPSEALDSTKLVETTLLDPAERKGLAQVCGGKVVDGGGARLELDCDLLRTGLGPRKDGAPEAKGVGIDQPDRLLVGRELLDAHDRTEDLLVPDSHLLGHPHQDGRRVVLATRLGGLQLASHEDLRAPQDGIVHEGLDVARLLRHAHGPAVHQGIEGCPLPHVLHSRNNLVQELVVDSLLDQNSFGARAVLTAGLEGRPQGDRDKLVQVGVVANDDRVFPSELQDHRRQVLRRGLEDLPADSRAPHEDQF
mmetsp:Transcript_6816/g.19926  ORF Transcript_6816/g.19926 Transcript_6816/m.19926 type:complete len:289 (+) Transcript_6816:222-1088(+)